MLHSTLGFNILRQLQAKMRNMQISGFGANYIRDFFYGNQISRDLGLRCISDGYIPYCTAPQNLRCFGCTGLHASGRTASVIFTDVKKYLLYNSIINFMAWMSNCWSSSSSCLFKKTSAMVVQTCTRHAKNALREYLNNIQNHNKILSNTVVHKYHVYLIAWWADCEHDRHHSIFINPHDIFIINIFILSLHIQWDNHWSPQEKWVSLLHTVPYIAWKIFENWLNIRHTLDKMYMTRDLEVQYCHIRRIFMIMG